MSLFSGLRKALKRTVRGVGKAIVGVASQLPGPVGAIARVGGVLNQARVSPMPIQAGLAIPRLPAPGGAIVRSLPGLGRVGGAVAGAGRAVGRAMSGATGRQVMRWSKRAAEAAGYIVTGSYILDAAGNMVGTVKRRQMNPLNHRALKRAARRVQASRKLLKQIEKLAGVSHRRAAPCAPKRKRC